MSYNWNNNFTSRDDLNINKSSFNQQNFGVNSTSKLNTFNGYQGNTISNQGTGFQTGGNLYMQNHQQKIDQVYKNGTRGFNNFAKTPFEEINTGKKETCLLTTISSMENFLEFSVEELRYIDYSLRKNNPNQMMHDTPQFNRLVNNPLVTNASNGYNQTITGSLGNFSVNRNNIGINPINSNINNTANNIDFNQYLRPNSSGISSNNTGITNTTSFNNNSFSNPTSINKFNTTNSGSITFQNTPVNIQNNPTNKLLQGNNNNVSVNIGMNGGSSYTNPVNSNKSMVNYFNSSNKNVFDNNGNNNPTPNTNNYNNYGGQYSINKNSIQANNIVSNNAFGNIQSGMNQSSNTINLNPLASGNTPTNSSFNNNFITSTSNNANFINTPTNSGNLTPQNKFNFSIQNPLNKVSTINTMPTSNIPFPNNNNNQNLLPFSTNKSSNTPSMMNIGNNLNFSTPSQSTINIGSMYPQNTQYGTTQLIQNNSFNRNTAFVNNPSTNLTFKSNSANNITFNNSSYSNNNINQMKSLNDINEVLTKLNSNDDYLGIRSMCQEVNSNLNNNFKFSKKELEEILDFSSLEEKNKKITSNLTSGTINKNNFSYTSKGNSDNYKEDKMNTTFTSNIFDTNSSRIVNLNNPLIKNFTQQKSNILKETSSYSNYNSRFTNLLTTVHKPLYKPPRSEDQKQERSMSKEFDAKSHQTQFKPSFNKVKKILTIQDILPLNNSKKATETNIVEKIDNLEEKSDNHLITLKNYKKNDMLQTGTDNNHPSNQLNYYKTQEYLNEIEKLAEEAVIKSVGPINNQQSAQRKGNLNIVQENKGFSYAKKFFSTEQKRFSKAKNNIQEVNFNNKNMNTIYESKDEIDGHVYDINALDYPNLKLGSNSINPEKNLAFDSYSDDCILNLKFQIFNPINLEFKIKINKKNKVIDLRKAIEELLKEKFPHDFKNSNFDNIGIFTKNGVLKDDDIIESKNFVNENEIINVFTINNCAAEEDEMPSGFSTKENINYINDKIMESDYMDDCSIKNDFDVLLNDPFDKMKEKMENESENSENLNKIKLLHPRPEFCPISLKYKTDPPYHFLVQMSKEELENLNNFSIFNEHGKISFKNATDVTYLNFDEIVNISPLYIDVYENVHPPKYGEKLNKEARIHVYNLDPSVEARNSDEEFSNFLHKVKNNLTDRNAQFIDYNHVKSELIFDVKSFDK